ncbi:hypothetical protein NDU88_009722 [Pleurodeles waltl]|uniref:Uncharacterized protein n=1 Tax=Pleurodeles waltl TaxID=8319 RepID=A0AAV7QYB3_PLEWA|nr:hypothetical protein NDU88_009722 [Pleurodeles waltl]
MTGGVMATEGGQTCPCSSDGHAEAGAVLSLQREVGGSRPVCHAPVCEGWTVVVNQDYLHVGCNTVLETFMVDESVSFAGTSDTPGRKSLPCDSEASIL